MEEIQKGRHSLAHIMAQAVLELYPSAKLGIGPAIGDGFYYDFDTCGGQLDHSEQATHSEPIITDIFPEIEKRMTAIIRQNLPLTYEKLEAKDAAREIFKDEPYKLELINDLPEDAEISVYRTGDKFLDLCKGPHFESTGNLGKWAFKLQSVAGAYWRGSEKNPMLQRIYAVAFPSKAELKDYLHRLEEAQKRDHRKLGPALDLFFLSDTAPGMPYWLPKGQKLFNTLLDFWREEHENRGYQEISSPLINHISLWQTSGHWEHYQENMFVIPPKKEEEQTMAVKPMNCPNAMVVYNRTVRSYRELPLRYSDCDVLHRDELSGALHGLFRVRMFRQDDSHNFITPDQIESEINAILDIADKFYGIFGLSYKPVLSTRPEDFMGDIKLWDKAESVLSSTLNKRYGEGKYEINDGDGAFYGPKIDLIMTDALGRPWQTGTIQLDFQLPHNFGLTYADRDGTLKEPVVIHRVIYGSLERFIGILIEHFTGAFPYWLSPVGVGLVPVRESHNAYALEVQKKLKDVGLRSEILLQDENMNGKIKKFRLAKVPYILIMGDKEIENNTVSVRTRSGKQIADVDIDKFVQILVKLTKEHTLELVEEF